MTGAGQDLDADAVRRALHAVLASCDFATSSRNRHFLQYIVEETLCGRADRIKAYTIATSVFGRDADFDPQLDSIVRIEAGRLRRALEHYYLAAGRTDAVRIAIPLGGYVPVFLPGAGSVAEAPPPRDPCLKTRRGCAILVSPFEEEGYQSVFPNFTRGLTRQVIVGLTRFTGLFVYGVETVLGHHAGTTEASEPLDADLLLAGGTTLAGDRFTLEVLLSDARTGRYIWGETFDRSLDPGAITAVRDEVANSIVRALAQPYGVIFSERARETEGRPPESLSSYEAVLLFHQYWRTYDRALFWTVRDALEKAILRDPSYAEAHACLSQIYSNWRRFGHEGPAEPLDPRMRALDLAQRAVELAPQSSRGHYALALAYWFSGDTAASLAALQRGHALNPNDTEIMADLGLRHALLMQWDKAVPLLEASYARNPAQPGTYWVGLALHDYMAGRFAEALAYMRRTKPEHVVHGFIVVAAASAQLGLRDEATSAVQSILGIAPGYGDHVVADLKARNVHPDMIAALVEGLRMAGLPGRDTGISLAVPAAAPRVGASRHT